jgi:metal transporter CNNM
MNLLTWIGIFICLSQSALLSGMNLGLFSLSKLELNVAAGKGIKMPVKSSNTARISILHW